MEIFNSVMLTGTIVIPIIAAAVYASHPYLSLWLGWLASVCAVTALFGGIHVSWVNKEPASAVQQLGHDQRPYIGVSRPRVDEFVEGRPVYFRVDLTNSGKTPATIIASGGRFAPFKEMSDIDGHMKYLASITTVDGKELVIPPGDTIELQGAPMVLDKGALDEVRKTNFFGGGVVIYRDVVGQQYETEFCFVLDWDSGRFFSAEQHNRME